MALLSVSEEYVLTGVELKVFALVKVKEETYSCSVVFEYVQKSL